MPVRFATLAFGRRTEEVERATRDLEQRLSSVAARLADGEEARLEAGREEVWLERWESFVFVRPTDFAGWPLVRAALGRTDSGLLFGVPKMAAGEAARRVLAKTGVAVEGWTVRVGVTRGHMLEVSWAVPLDAREEFELLEDAADHLTEALLGTESFERWVRVNAVVRSPRRSALRPLAAGDEVERFSCAEASALLERAIDLVRASLPASLLAPTVAAWTALEIGAGAALGRQPERSFASTTQPEALKCFLEGASFSSARFTRGAELFGSVECLFEEGERGARRARFEERFEGFGSKARLVGTGFGKARDYFDFVATDDEEAMLALVEALRGFDGARVFRLFDCELGVSSVALR